MKKIILISLLSINAFSWTLVAKDLTGYSSSEITIDIAATSCTNAGFSTSELKDLVKEAIDMYWNKVPTSSIKLSVGKVTNTSIDGATAISAVVAKTSNNKILIGCNDDVASFTDGFTGGIGGISCTDTECKGGVILNAHANSKLDTYSKLELHTLIGHELGHALGLGHSSLEEALMYYSVGSAQEHLHQDDMNGITWLFPNEKELGGLAGSCGTITFTDGPGKMQYTLFFMVFLLISISLMRRKFRVE